MGTTAEKFNYAFGAKDLLKSEINKINNVLDDNSTFRSYPQELFNGYLDILNNGTDTLWSNLEKVSQTGTEAVLENVETAPMKMVLNGNTSQDGTPTPDTPVEVKVVTGENVVSVSGKNLFDKDNQTKVQVNAEGTLRYGLIVDAPNKKVSISAKTWGQAIAYKTLIGGVYGQFSTTNRNSTFEIEEKIIFYNSKGDVQPLDFGIEDLQIEISDIPTSYVPYSKTDYPINLGDIELCKINTYKDYFHKDSGKWYVHKEIGKYELDENAYFTQNWNTNTDYETYCMLHTLNTNFGSNAIAISNILPYVSNVYGYDKIGIYQEKNSGGRIIFRVPKTIANSVSEFQTWLASNSMIVYTLIAPTETEITNSTLIEQLEAISKAKSVKDKTYITQTNDELPFILDVEAIKEYEVN